jgi:hypothetical protein
MDDPNAESDLATYRSTFGLPACTTANGCFRKVNQNGAASPLPATDTGWAAEISLDVDMVSAVCPSCHILLVEASTASLANLGTGVNTAVALGAKYVSNSYGGGDSSPSSAYNHAGVAVTASTGDGGFGVEYPASDSHVVAVGGTSLTRDASARGWNETAWSGAGSGCSTVNPKPAWQTAATQCARKANADVSAVADPNTGVAVNVTFGGTGFEVFGGTSASSPIIASVYALAGTPAATSSPASFPWSHTGNLFDVVSGSNGACTPAVLCHAGAGWDGPTGLGTPNGTAAFSAGTAPPPPGCTAGQLLGNPGFETGTLDPWTGSAGAVVQADSVSTPAHSGSWSAGLVDDGTPVTVTLSQTVTIPAGCSSYTLSFWEMSTVRNADQLTVTLNGGPLQGFRPDTSYRQRSYNLSRWAGQTVTVGFTSTMRLAEETLIDDAALIAS